MEVCKLCYRELTDEDYGDTCLVCAESTHEEIVFYDYEAEERLECQDERR